MASKLTLTLYDYSLESSPAGFQGVNLTAGNLTAQFGLMDDLKAAVQGITLGTTIREVRVAVEQDSTKTQPVSAFAQREMKWLVRYIDTVNPNGNGTIEIPTPDLSLLDSNGVYMDVSAGTPGEDFVTAFEAFQRSRLGNTVTFVNAEFVGRNI